MRVLWVTTALFIALAVTPTNADPKKYNHAIHSIKKAVVAESKAKSEDATTTTASDDKSKTTQAEKEEVTPAEGKSVTGITTNPLLDYNQRLVAQQKAGLVIGIPAGVTADGTAPALGLGLGPLLAALFGGGGLPGGPGPILAPLAAIATGLFAVLAAIGAGIAALIGFIVPGLQIANQVLAIIGIALLIAYLVEKKKEGDDYYYEDSGYGDYDSGYSVSSYPQETYGAPESSGYSADTSGYSAPVSSGYSGPAASGTSSYSSYRRADEAPNPDGSRSRANRPIVNRVARMVNNAVKKYSEMYSE